MQYRTHGNTGIEVAALGFGAMRLPFDETDQSVELLRMGMDLGINYIDTAHGYGGGRSEEVVGLAVKGRRDDVYIATKNPLHDETEKGWWERLETSLRRLQTDRIDFYKIVHGLSWDVFTRVYEPVLHKEALKAQEQGIIGHIVFSCHDTPENMIRLLDTGLFAGLLLQYNLLDRANEEVIAHAHANGYGVEVMGPVGGGRLGMSSEKLESLVSDVASTADLALRFVLANPNVTVAFSGMNEKAHIIQNAATASREEVLSATEVKAIGEALDRNKALAQLYCTGCEYCLPCPQGVGIPQAFSAMNMHRVWGFTDHARRMYSRLGPENKDGLMQADACVECGACEEKCPQNIEIIEQLRETHSALGE